MNKKWLALLFAAALIFSLGACGKQSGGTVYVENVGKIVEKGSIAVSDKFPGVVISEDRVEIRKDDSQTITALHVEEGQEVNTGDVLFSYDSEALSLELSKLRLELERLNNTVTTLKTQIAQLQKEQKEASKEDQLSYTVEIQDRQAQLEEAEYNVKVKNKEIEQVNTALRNVNVVSPISGKVISIDVNDTGELNGAYMIIQQFGNYRIRGTVNELNMASITAGAVVNVTSRSNDTQAWKGVISSIDLESAQQQESINPDSSMMTSSSYSFYVELENSQGLMLGQHVYLELSGLVSENEGIWLPEYYICYDTEGNVFVWAESGEGLLERRAITLGGYDDTTFTVEILSGLSEQDYIAFPAETCHTGAATIREDGTVATGNAANDQGENAGNSQENDSDNGEADDDEPEGAQSPELSDTKSPNEGGSQETPFGNGQLIGGISLPGQSNSGSSGSSGYDPASDGDLVGSGASSDGDLED